MVLNSGGSGRGSPVVGYVRSALRGDAMLDLGVSQIYAYAERHGLRVDTVIRDDGTSAVTAWRPKLDVLVRGLERGRWPGVVIPSLEHLGRPRSLALRNLARLRATSAWVAFVDDKGVPSEEAR